MSSVAFNSKTREFQKRIERIEQLIQALETGPDNAARAQTRELVRTLLELHGEGLNHLLETLYQNCADGQALIDRLARDPLISNLLLLHGLHPLDLETRVRNALEEVKPRLGLHGGNVHLVGVTPEGAVRLQLEGNCEGCPSSRVTLKYSIEEALYAAAPDIIALEVNGLVEEHTTPMGNPRFTVCPSTSDNGQMPAGIGGKR